MLLGKYTIFPKTREIQKKKKAQQRLLGNHKRTQHLRGSPLKAMSTELQKISLWWRK